MEIIGFISASIIGIVLGLIGGGGSILTVPVLVYLFSISPLVSTSYSLIIVGVTSLAGVFANLKNNSINYSTGILFSIPALISVYLTRRFFLPAIPAEIFRIESVIFSKDLLIMIVFAALMIFSSFGMIKDKKYNFVTGNITQLRKGFYIVIEGFVVGFLTGLVGAGGGFLIIPALVLFANLDMKVAVGTSLFIIAIKSLIGFLGDMGADVQIDWNFLLIFTSISVLGMIVGANLAKIINSKKLKPAFGWFVLTSGMFIIIQNIISLGGK